MAVVNLVKGFDCLDLHDYTAFNNQIRYQSIFDPGSFEDEADALFAFNIKSLTFQIA